MCARTLLPQDSTEHTETLTQPLWPPAVCETVPSGRWAVSGRAQQTAYQYISANVAVTSYRRMKIESAGRPRGASQTASSCGAAAPTGNLSEAWRWVAAARATTGSQPASGRFNLLALRACLEHARRPVQSFSIDRRRAPPPPPLSIDLCPLDGRITTELEAVMGLARRRGQFPHGLLSPGQPTERRRTKVSPLGDISWQLTSRWPENHPSIHHLDSNSTVFVYFSSYCTYY